MAEVQDRTLRDVAIGDTATVRRLTGEGALKRHIMDMGITKGTSVFVRKVAPGRSDRGHGARIRAVASQARGGEHPHRLTLPGVSAR